MYFTFCFNGILKDPNNMNYFELVMADLFI